jgi:pimeloyl-ACP methyl ester carboxylesterase
MNISLSTGQTLSFDHHGHLDAQPVVFLHGLSGSRTTYGEVANHLVAGPVARGEVQTFMIDLRGHGQSSWGTYETYDTAHYAADIIAFIEQVIGKPIALVGHSLGGLVAAATATARPDLVQALLLEDPPFFEGDEDVRNASPVAAFFPKLVAAVRALQARNAPASDYEPLVRDTTPPEDWSARCEMLRPWDPSTMQAAIDGVVWRTFDPVATFACPVTILQADPAFGGVFKPHDGPLVMATNPHADIVLVPGAAHGIHDQPTLPAYLRELDRFLASL